MRTRRRAQAPVSSRFPASRNSLRSSAPRGIGLQAPSRSPAARLFAGFLGTFAVYLHIAPTSGADPGPPPVSPKPEFRVGDWWEFSKRHMRQKCRRWEVVEVDPDGLLIQQCDDHRIYRDYANHLQVVRVTKGNKDVVTFTPALQSLIFPLEVGKKWEQEYFGFTADNGNEWKSRTSWEVTAYESVTVAAGTFDAYRIEIFEAWEEVDGDRVTLEATAWWSPAAKMFVKHEHGDPGDPRWSYELTAFKLVPASGK